MAHTVATNDDTGECSGVEDYMTKQASRLPDGSLHPGRTIHDQVVKIGNGYLVCVGISRQPHAPPISAD